MAQIKLESELRAGTGKGVARKLRVQGRVPGVVYGPSVEPILIGMDEKTLLTHLQKKGMNQIIELEVKNGSASDTHLCLIKEVQRDVYQQHILHIDFRRIDLKEKVVVNIRVNLEGQAAIKAWRRGRSKIRSRPRAELLNRWFAPSRFEPSRPIFPTA